MIDIAITNENEISRCCFQKGYNGIEPELTELKSDATNLYIKSVEYGEHAGDNSNK